MIQREEAETYGTLWESGIGYEQNSPGLLYLPIFQSLAPVTWKPSVLDAGCGSGKAGVELAKAGYDVTLCDITPAGLVDEAKSLPFVQACLWKDLRRGKWFHYVYCCDVLEHIPTQYTMLAVEQMLRVTKNGLFISVSLMPDMFGAWIGKPLHKTVQPFVWWRDSLNEVGEVDEARDLINNAIFMVRPK